MFLTGKFNRSLAVPLLLGLFLFISAPVLAQEAAPAGEGAKQELSLPGKLLCLKKEPGIQHYGGKISFLSVNVGDPVQKDQILAKYLLDDEAVFALRQRLSQNALREMKIRVDNTDSQLSRARGEYETTKQLAEKNLASKDKVKLMEQEYNRLLEIQKEQRALLKETSQRYYESLDILKKTIGDSLTPDFLPSEVEIKAPCDGHILWIHPDMSIGATFPPNSTVMWIGVMNPMVFRTQVFESEAMRIKKGDAAKFYPQSLPGREFSAIVSQISWLPVSTDLNQPTYYSVEFRVANPEMILKEGMMGQTVMKLGQ